MINTKNKLYTIKDKKIIQLSEEDKEKLEEVLLKFDTVLDSDIKLLYRGDSLSNIKMKLNTEDLDNTFGKVFTLGEKSNSLFIPSNKNNSDLSRIDSVSNQVFIDIFEKISEVINTHNPSVKLQNFILNNQEFVKYFKDDNNKNDFTEKINKSSKKLFLKDYYMAFLHTEGKIVKDKSYFLSSSEELKIAEKFANSQDINNRVVFCYFINKPFLQFGIFSKNKGYLKKEIENSKLVSYTPLHENEIEFSIRGGFLPHYILYIKYYQKRKKMLILNPYIFVDEYDPEKELGEGFPVDQENFINDIRETNYNGYFEQDEEGTRQHDINE